MDAGKKKGNLNLYHKFALAMILLGLFPMLVLSTFMMNTILEEYESALSENYKQAAIHISSSVENMLSVYNSASKAVYSYEPGTQTENPGYSVGYDMLRRVLTGEIFAYEDRDSEREEEMRLFLQNIENTDGYIYAVHFVAEIPEIGRRSFHFSRRKTFFQDEEAFYDSMGYEEWDTGSKNLMLIPTHKTEYYNGVKDDVFTVARNY